MLKLVFPDRDRLVLSWLGDLFPRGWDGEV